MEFVHSSFVAKPTVLRQPATATPLDVEGKVELAKADGIAFSISPKTTYKLTSSLTHCGDKAKKHSALQCQQLVQE